MYVDFNKILSFDDYGVSGHTNHRAIYGALKKGVLNGSVQQPVFALKSVSVPEKYSFLLGSMLMTILDYFKTSDKHFSFVSDFKAYRKGRAAMYLHESQMVWFRHLYLLTSCYMIRNEFFVLNPAALANMSKKSNNK